MRLSCIQIFLNFLLETYFKTRIPIPSGIPEHDFRFLECIR